MEVALASLSDARGVRAAMVGVDSVIHLAGEEGLGGRADLLTTDVNGTRNLTEAAAEAGVERVIYLSHVGADRASAYSLMRAKAAAEEHIQSSTVPNTILRSGVVFGAEDRFTTAIAMQLAMSPVLFPIPGDGSTLLQPLWVEDIATCITWMLDDASTVNQTYEIGGPEYISYYQILRMVLNASGMTRILVPTRPPYLRALAWLVEHTLRRSPISTFWLDYLAVNRTAELDALPSAIGLQPSRMEDRLQYLRGRNWGWELISQQFVSSNGGSGS